MCGIFGLSSQRQYLINKVDLAGNILHHRGPDDDGYLLFDTRSHILIRSAGNKPDNPFHSSDKDDFEFPFNLALVHRRLSILDLISRWESTHVKPRWTLLDRI
jgi:asparagine synthase (glutamine-hydrolysing)